MTLRRPWEPPSEGAGPAGYDWHRGSARSRGVLSFGQSAMFHELHADVDFVRDTSSEALSVFYEISGNGRGFFRAVASRVPRELMIRAYG